VLSKDAVFALLDERRELLPGCFGGHRHASLKLCGDSPMAMSAISASPL
jgi:hypothetical protein